MPSHISSPSPSLTHNPFGVKSMSTVPKMGKHGQRKVSGFKPFKGLISFAKGLSPTSSKNIKPDLFARKVAPEPNLKPAFNRQNSDNSIKQPAFNRQDSASSITEATLDAIPFNLSQSVSYSSFGAGSASGAKGPIEVMPPTLDISQIVDYIVNKVAKEQLQSKSQVLANVPQSPEGRQQGLQIYQEIRAEIEQLVKKESSTQSFMKKFFEGNQGAAKLNEIMIKAFDKMVTDIWTAPGVSQYAEDIEGALAEMASMARQDSKETLSNLQQALASIHEAEIPIKTKKLLANTCQACVRNGGTLFEARKVAEHMLDSVIKHQLTNEQVETIGCETANWLIDESAYPLSDVLLASDHLASNLAEGYGEEASIQVIQDWLDAEKDEFDD